MLPKPDLANYQFTGVGSSLFEIDLEMASKALGPNSTLSGYFTIGINAFVNLSYTLTVSSSDITLSHLHIGMPVSYKNKDNATFYSVFVYKHSVNQSFKIKISEDSGFAHILARPLNSTVKQQEFMDIVEEWSLYPYNSLETENRVKLNIEKEDEEFCFDCKYLIIVKSNHEMAGKITVSEISNSAGHSTEILLLGRPELVDLYVNETKNFKFVLNSDKDVEINMNTISGEANFVISTINPKDESKINDEFILFKGNSTDSYYKFSTENPLFKDD